MPIVDFTLAAAPAVSATARSSISWGYMRKPVVGAEEFSPPIHRSPFIRILIYHVEIQNIQSGTCCFMQRKQYREVAASVIGCRAYSHRCDHGQHLLVKFFLSFMTLILHVSYLNFCRATPLPWWTVTAARLKMHYLTRSMTTTAAHGRVSALGSFIAFSSQGS
jgi:hypothetical protein